MKRAPSCASAWGGWILLVGCSHHGGMGRDGGGGAGGTSSLRDAAAEVSEAGLLAEAGSAGDADDAGGVDINCIAICTLRATASCGPDDGCVDRCESDQGRQHCRAETDALFGCALQQGSSGVTCRDGGVVLPPDRCPEQAQALMACLVGAG